MNDATRDLREMVRAIPDYPKTGIIFRDVTTLFGNAEGLARTVDAIADHVAGHGIDLIAGIDARGFILGGALAVRMRKGFVPIRKRGKLPADVYREEYSLEYGTDEVEIHKDAVPAGGATVLLVDDLIATGGTAIAAARLIQRAGGTVPMAAFAIDLPELGGARKLAGIGIDSYAVMSFEGH
ncbi:adenine phosphoribosyltransferase [Acuticoccus sediminis]|uniref:Adenine phosphoribosyltransferase n=1 Tax=Acuticoccus sediminis TaxID=2184697 RepID=A0A8B2NKK6_9HYPH|nr:adenine phosphoribosyltransferase [Acuticoccus sediminis]RAI00036.1 adenine phosphoribosyltransferase [Acuticoccus sediminis]